jgi:hypothetical protein
MNTDEFEGHTEGPWEAAHPNHQSQIMTGICALGKGGLGNGLGIYENHAEGLANAKLILAAPDLLAEVKRLRGLLKANSCCTACGKYLGQCNDENECIRLGGWTMEEAKEAFE